MSDGITQSFSFASDALEPFFLKVPENEVNTFDCPGLGASSVAAGSIFGLADISCSGLTGGASFPFSTAVLGRIGCSSGAKNTRLRG